MEIERKFKVLLMPENLSDYKVRHIEQGYLCTKPTLRIRKADDKYIFTFKMNKNEVSGESAIYNEELEYNISEKAYEHLKSKVDGNLIQKERYLIPLEGGLTAELDVFCGRLSGLCFVEVEFSDGLQAEAFVKPHWFGEEVTFDRRYRNSHLAMLPSFDQGHFDSAAESAAR